MRAVRAHLRFGAVAALLALALQLGLSFGHFHRAASPLATAGVVADAVPGAHGQPSPDGLLPDDCDICASIMLAGTAVHAQPPVLPVPVAFTPAMAIQGESVAPRSVRFAAFRSRAPPIS
ncbi:MAG: DUF2946 domain-containing protein [Xanthobacteraceae bacterium]|nr:DUF2946 domain-containing protein [Xanthobacteraceae bacterium]